ncbi:AAA family ATPase [Actinoplanes sp. NPDC051859]|uniref:AAA family ATPase n=1 Tax=Actinoplanes sp. NPDC051859 TaxID=3363909 RepID=UPI003792C354
MTMFAPATRKQAKARLALVGPSGAGKTLTGLKLLYTLTGARTVGDGRARIAFIDTERDSADKYAADPTLPGVADMTPEQAGGHGFSKVSPVRYDPRELVTMVEDAALAGFTGLQVDSLSHYWFGAGGVLELVDLFTRNAGGRSLDGWRDVRPIERSYIEALMAFPGHVVVCLRSKQRYEIEDGHDGRKRVAKLGMQPDQREGLEFEFDVVGDIDSEHYLRISKTRCDVLDGQVIHKPGQELGEQLLDWLAHGEPPKAVDWDQVLADCTSRDDLAVWWQQAQRAGQSAFLRDKFASRGQEITAARNNPTVPAAASAAPQQEQAAETGDAAGEPSAQDSAAVGRRPVGARAKSRTEAVQ